MSKLYVSELIEIQKYIDTFDPEKFSSTSDWDIDTNDADRLAMAKRIRARIERKKMMAASFSMSIKQDASASKQMISQKQIDELLRIYS